MPLISAIHFTGLYLTWWTEVTALILSQPWDTSFLCACESRWFTCRAQRPKPLLSHGSVRGALAPCKLCATVYSISSYSIWQTRFSHAALSGFGPWMLIQYYSKHFLHPDALSQWQMLTASKPGGTTRALNLGLMSISDFFSGSTRIMAMLINQLASPLEITILRS